MVDFWKVIGVYRSLIDNYGALEIWGAGVVAPTCAVQYTGLTESLGLGYQVFYPVLKATFGITGCWGGEAALHQITGRAGRIGGGGRGRRGRGRSKGGASPMRQNP